VDPPENQTLFSGHYLRNLSTLDIGVLAYIGIFYHKSGTFLLGHLYMELGMCNMAPDSISTAYLINPSHQPVCLRAYLHIVAKQRLCEHLPKATNANKKKIVRRFVFWSPCRIKGESISVYPYIVVRQRLVEYFSATKKNCWRHSFLCNACRMK
jgi:hypothetical protein